MGRVDVPEPLAVTVVVPFELWTRNVYVAAGGGAFAEGTLGGDGVAGDGSGGLIVRPLG